MEPGHFFRRTRQFVQPSRLLTKLLERLLVFFDALGSMGGVELGRTAVDRDCLDVFDKNIFIDIVNGCKEQLRDERPALGNVGPERMRRKRETKPQNKSKAGWTRETVDGSRVFEEIDTPFTSPLYTDKEQTLGVQITLDPARRLRRKNGRL